ncbi:hypothetical protein FOA52_007014 [Chlamydomonas sp. UWO 241]|nr:hypothetical protein FOA52_007014 [Chlamydomonas sp. UWO 241]
MKRKADGAPAHEAAGGGEPEDESEASSCGHEGSDDDGERSPKQPASASRPARGAGGGQASMSMGSPASHMASTCRQDSSLGKIAKDFLQLLQAAKNGDIDRNCAAEELQVKKRRIYDITNVLEGVGLLTKKTKNIVHWVPAGNVEEGPKKGKKGQAGNDETAVAALAEGARKLDTMEAALNESIAGVTRALEATCAHPANKQQLYITDTMIRALPTFAESSVFAMRAPAGTTIQLREPRGNQFNLEVRSQGDPIEVYLVSQALDGPEGEHVSSDAAAAAAAGVLPSTAGCASTLDAVSMGGGAGGAGGGETAAARASRGTGGWVSIGSTPVRANHLLGTGSPAMADVLASVRHPTFLGGPGSSFAHLPPGFTPLHGLMSPSFRTDFSPPNTGRPEPRFSVSDASPLAGIMQMGNAFGGAGGGQGLLSAHTAPPTA